MNSTTLQLYAIVELFGHTTVSGTVSESEFGDDFLRIDIPATDHQPAFTRMVNKKAIYAINPVTEEVMKIKAESLNKRPIESWDIREMQKKLMLNLPQMATHEDRREFEEED